MKNNESGFTILELMITVLMVAILAAASIPSFLGLIQSRQVSSTTTELISYLSLARQEAIGQNHSIKLIGLDSANETSVLWGKGLSVGLDANNDDDFDDTADGDKLIIVGEPSSNVSIKSNVDQKGFKFLASGFKSGTGLVTFDVCPGSNGTKGRRVSVLGSGQITQKEFNCGAV